MTDETTRKLFERLSQTVIPTHYDLTIQSFLDTFKFNGHVIIHIQIKEPTGTIILYAAKLQIDDAKLTLNSKDDLNGKIEIDEENERVQISFDQRLEKGDYQLSLKFIGDINDCMHGFYRNKYTTPD